MTMCERMFGYNSARKCFLTLALLMLLCPGSSYSQQHDEVEELQRIYIELKAEYERYRKIQQNPELFGDESRTALQNMGTLEQVVDRLSKEIKKAGGEIPNFVATPVQPGSEVTALDAASGEKVVKSSADCFQTGRKSSAYVFPEGEQSGTKRLLAGILRETEAKLAEHLTMCKRKWTKEEAVAWHGQRDILIEQILALEHRYALAFTYPKYTDEENKIIAQAYKGSPELRRKIGEEQRLFGKYMELKQLADDMRKKYKLAGDPVTRLKVIDLTYRAEKARDVWWQVANKITKLRGPRVQLLKKAKALRLQRGLGLMKQYYPEVVFTFHYKKEYIDPDSPLLVGILGTAGIEILKKEGEKRGSTR